MLGSFLGEKLREQDHSNVSLLRKTRVILNFVVPELNLECHHYTNALNWLKVVVTEPITMTLHDKNNQINIGFWHGFIPQKFPAHKQSVERAFKLVSDASVEVCSYEPREEFIRSRFDSHSRVPSFASKKVLRFKLHHQKFCLNCT